MTGRRHLHAVTVADELAAIQADPAHRAAVAANAVDDDAADFGPVVTPTVKQTVGAMVSRIVWTEDDVYFIGDRPDGHGCVTVTLKRGSIVQTVKVRMTVAEDAIKSYAVGRANGRA